MVRICAIVLLAFLVSSCSHTSESDLALYKSIQRGLAESSNVIDQSSNEIYRAIEQRAEGFGEANYAKKWQPKALLIKDMSANTSIYIDTLITALKIKAGLKMENGREIFREDDKKAVKSLFIDDNKGKELQARLMKYKTDMLSVDTEISKAFEHIMFDVSDSLFAKGFTKTYFEDVPAIAALAILKKYKNEIAIAENQFLRWCLNKTQPVVIIDDFLTPLISQSSNYVKQGDEIIITAGIGSFASISNTKIRIGAKIIKDDVSGIVTYKFKALGNVGKKIIPIRMECSDESGKKLIFERIVEYTIIE